MLIKVLSGWSISSLSLIGSSGKWTSDEWVITYGSGSTYTSHPLQRSFAEVDLTDLTTFSGDVARAKIYLKSVDNAGEYEQVADLILERTELTTTQSEAGTTPVTIQTGYLLDQAFADQYWIGDSMASSSYYD